MWISGNTEGLENIFLLLQSTSNPDKRVYAHDILSIQPKSNSKSKSKTKNKVKHNSTSAPKSEV